MVSVDVKHHVYLLTYPVSAGWSVGHIRGDVNNARLRTTGDKFETYTRFFFFLNAINYDKIQHANFQCDPFFKLRKNT